MKNLERKLEDSINTKYQDNSFHTVSDFYKSGRDPKDKSTFQSFLKNHKKLEEGKTLENYFR